MHTNGILLQPGKKHQQLLPRLAQAGLTMVTFSIASFDREVNKALMQVEQDASSLIKQARQANLLVRCSLVVNKQGAADFDGVMEYIRQAGQLGAQMVVIREIWVPDVYGDYNKEVYRWNLKNKVLIKPIQDEFKRQAKKGNNHGLRQLNPLPWGTPVFVVEGGFDDPAHGVNVTFALCDEATTGPVMKSIVHKPNGHGYRNWDYNGDILY